MMRAAVLGSPIAHSLSPVIHQRAYDFLGWDWSYSKCEVASGQLMSFLSERSGEFRGLSLTMPLKEEALALLDSVTELGKRVYAINTIVFDDLGSHGFNTDVQGFRDALKYRNVPIPEEVAVLGGGATARSAIAAVDDFAKRIIVYSRSEHRTRALVNSAEHAIVTIRPWEEVGAAMENELIISTTPKGATDGIAINDVNWVHGTLFESLYHPWPTHLLHKWQEKSGNYLDGLDLLVWQAIGQLEVMSFNPSEIVDRRGDLFVAMREAALAHI